MKTTNAARSPRLETVLMVERFIKKTSGTYKRRSLWERLPKRVMYQTYKVIIDYLEEGGKIAIDREGHIAWVWDPEGVKYYLSRKDLEPKILRRRRGKA